VLGRFEVRIGERIVIDGSWSRRKAMALFKLLALQRDRSLHRERALDILWPNLAPQAAGNNLRKNVHRLRSRVGEPAGALISTAGDMLVLAPEVRLDMDEFQAVAAQACANMTCLFDCANATVLLLARLL
jgi:DNA-binding SARP family transcriptional activator